MKHIPLSALITPPPTTFKAVDYDWQHCYSWSATHFLKWAQGKNKRQDVAFEDDPPLDLGYGTRVLGPYNEDKHVYEGIEFDDGTCLVAWTVSEFVGTFHSNDVSVWYFIATPRNTPHVKPKNIPSYRDWIPVKKLMADGSTW